MTRRADGRWQEAIVIDGKRKYFYGKTKSEVLRKIREHEEKDKAGRLFPAVANEWWDKHEPTLAHNTMMSYRPAVRRVQDHFTNTDMASIRPVDIMRFLTMMVEENAMADKTARTQLLVTNLICRYAVSEGYIDINPCAEVHVPKGLKKKPRDMPSHSDLELVKQNIDHEWGFFAFLILCTGLRRGEALALQWKDVNLKKRTITVNKSVYHIGNSTAIKSTKTESGTRTVPILNALFPHLKPGPADHYIFGGTALLPKSRSEKGWEHYCRDTGVKCTPHQLRHAYATMLWEAKVEPEIAMKLLGHAQISTTRDIYTHIRDERQLEEHEKLLAIELIK